MVEYKIDIPDELRNLNLAANYVRARQTYLVPAMDKSIATTKARVKGLVPVGVTGEARSSITTLKVESPYQVVGKITSTMRRPMVYIYVLNAGIRAGQGKQPPSDKLVPWVLKRGLASDLKEAQRVAFAIARSIKKRGMKGLSFQWRGLQDSKDQIEKYHQDAIENITKELGKNG